jgi:hypothetical protein
MPHLVALIVEPLPSGKERLFAAAWDRLSTRRAQDTAAPVIAQGTPFELSRRLDDWMTGRLIF